LQFVEYQTNQLTDALVPCSSFCTGGLCKGDECTCTTQWSGKRCENSVIVITSNKGDNLTEAIVLLCFSLLLLASILMYFVCIVRP
jgi:hypothetical protein